MYFDKNDPDFKAFEAEHNKRLGILKKAILSVLAADESQNGLLEEMVKANVLRLDIPEEAKAYLRGQGLMVSATFSIIMVQLLGQGLVRTNLVTGEGCYYKMGPLEKLAVQG